MFCTLTDATGRVRFKAVAVTDYAEDSDGVLLISLGGAQQAVRAVWANLVKWRTGRYTQETEIILRADDGDKKLRVNPEKHYSSAWQGTDTLIILREEFRKERARYILGGDQDTPSAWFSVALRNIPEMPYRDEWLPALWKHAIEKELVLEIKDSTIPVWAVRTYAPTWLEMLKTMVRKGVVQ
jgi:hypothetical protein